MAFGAQDGPGGGEEAGLLAEVAHELRTPLGAILGFAELLGMSPPARAPEYLAHIRDCGTHMQALIDGLIEFGGTRSGAAALAEENVAPRALLDDAALLVGPQAAARGIAIAVGVEPPLDGASLRGDRRALRRILANLLANAVRYTHAGDRIALLARPAADGGAELSVVDHGPGIPAAELARLGEPFRRGSAERARGSPGSGLGLAISRALAQAHGGALRLESAPGAGTRATLVLPAARIERAAL